MDIEDILTVKEAAGFSTCSERHVRNLIHSELVTAYRPGKRHPLPGKGLQQEVS